VRHLVFLQVNMKKTTKISSLLILSIAVALIDWGTKNWAKKHLFYEQSKSYLNGVFTLDYAENKGAALSLGTNLPDNQAFWLLQIAPLLLILFLLAYVLNNIGKLKIWEIIAFAGIFGGGIANLVDRFLNNRHVIDFMIVEVFGFKTGIFNFADMFISFGILFLFITSLFNTHNNNRSINETP
jgi:signal peptidase II